MEAWTIKELEKWLKVFDNPNDLLGYFTNTEVIAANTSGAGGSGASATANGSGAIVGGDLERFSGDIIYVENRSPVSRASDQIEDVKLIIEF